MRVNSPNDSAQAKLDGFMNISQGDIVEMTCLASEFPTVSTNDLGAGSMNSTTQLQPIPGIAINIVGSQRDTPLSFVDGKIVAFSRKFLSKNAISICEPTELSG